MKKYELSPSVILMGLGGLVVLWIIGKIVGASFFFIAACVILFLILLITYLVIRLHDEPILEKIKSRQGIISSTNPKYGAINYGITRKE